jgi:thioesterase superfamily protein 4
MYGGNDTLYPLHEQENPLLTFHTLPPYAMRNDLRTGLDHLEYFKSIPWCAKYVDDPKNTITPTLSRIVEGSTEDSFFAETLRTERTIRKCLTLNSLPDKTLDPPSPKVCTFFELGDGLNSFPNISHGGFVATMMDEEMGILLTVNQTFMNEQTGTDGELTSMTAYLNIKYVAPVRTPGIVLVTAEVTKSEKRKLFVKGLIQNESGKVLAESECLFIKAKSDPRAKI